MNGIFFFSLKEHIFTFKSFQWYKFFCLLFVFIVEFIFRFLVFLGTYSFLNSEFYTSFGLRKLLASRMAILTSCWYGKSFLAKWSCSSSYISLEFVVYSRFAMFIVDMLTCILILYTYLKTWWGRERLKLMFSLQSLKNTV